MRTYRHRNTVLFRLFVSPVYSRAQSRRLPRGARSATRYPHGGQMESDFFGDIQMMRQQARNVRLTGPFYLIVISIMLAFRQYSVDAIPI